MRSVPKSLDGSQGDVHDDTGMRVAGFALDDRREKPGDPVYAVFEDREPTWEDRLVAGAGRGLHVSLVWQNGRRLDQVSVLKAYVPPFRSFLTAAADDPELGFESADFGIPLGDDEQPSSLDAVYFGIDHADL